MKHARVGLKARIHEIPPIIQWEASAASKISPMPGPNYESWERGSQESWSLE